METLFIPNENDFKKWIRAAIKEYLQDSIAKSVPIPEKEESLLTRKEAAKLLRISLVTLTDWMKRGLPCHKQRGRVYFIRLEVLEYIKTNRMAKAKFSGGFSEITNLD